MPWIATTPQCTPTTTLLSERDGHSAPGETNCERSGGVASWGPSWGPVGTGRSRTHFSVRCLSPDRQNDAQVEPSAKTKKNKNKSTPGSHKPRRDMKGDQEQPIKTGFVRGFQHDVRARGDNTSSYWDYNTQRPCYAILLLLLLLLLSVSLSLSVTPMHTCLVSPAGRCGIRGVIGHALDVVSAASVADQQLAPANSEQGQLTRLSKNSFNNDFHPFRLIPSCTARLASSSNAIGSYLSTRRYSWVSP